MSRAANQSAPFEDVNLFVCDPALRRAVVREGAAHALGALEAYGADAGSAEMQAHARSANANRPVLRTHDPRGERIDHITYDPGYHALMQLGVGAGLHAASWSYMDATPDAAGAATGAGQGDLAIGSNVARAAGLVMASQLEPGHVCPLTMTNAAVATLMGDEGMALTMVPRILARRYDPELRHMSEKSSLTVGMAMTERQGGSDVRANLTTATPLGGPDASGDDGYLVNGEKWFMSAPMSDAFLILAQAPGGLSCFMMPRVLPDGEMNGIHLRRLKSKLGNHANASAEVVFDEAQAWRIGEEGRGIPVIMEMVTHTRLDCALGSLGLMRRGLVEAIHHVRQRATFGRRLIEQPLMQQVLADMALHVEACTALTMRLARAFDQPEDEQERAWARLLTPIVKYWVCKSAPAFLAEAMECLGGNGYVEDFPLALLYREAPVNAIWEGAGNMMALDVLRVLQRDADVLDLVFLELGELSGGHRLIDQHLADTRALLFNPREIDANLRALTDRLASVAAAALMHVHAERDTGAAYVESRLEPGRLTTFGARQIEGAAAIVEAALP
ncbi:MAG: acyl-CoA dehydrogenase family protein [Pseudomonadota bacterium]